MGKDVSIVLGRQDKKAGVKISVVSLPLREKDQGLRKIKGIKTQVVPVGYWPETSKVRRQLMFGMSQQEIPEKVEVVEGEDEGEYKGPQVEIKVIKERKTGIVLLEEDEIEIGYEGKKIGIRMGLVHKGEIHWWEWVRMEKMWSGPVCEGIIAGGFIEVDRLSDEDLKEEDIWEAIHKKRYHNHNWLRAEVYMWLFTNGVIKLTLRHINNHLFDHGKDLIDVIPVIGFSGDIAHQVEEQVDGSKTRYSHRGIELNIEPAKKLVSSQQPGRMYTEQGVMIYQPYKGVEIYGDSFQQKRQDRYIVKAEDRIFPKGVARNVEMLISMGEIEPEITRLVVPDWWYAMTGSLWVDDVLAVKNEKMKFVERMEDTVIERKKTMVGNFDNSILNRGLWEGEIPYSQIFYSYLSGNLEFLEIGIHEAYHFADIGFDHATETIRMQEYPFGAIAPPLYRVVGLVYGYLETGDVYLLDCAKSAAERYYQIDRHNWPRRTYGRDAASLRSLVYLWDYVGSCYLEKAREGITRAIKCIREDGSTGDQGGAVGIQGGVGNETTKTWMALLEADVMIDYLMRKPGDKEVEEFLKKRAQFILDSQIEKDGEYYWAYQYKYGDNPGDPWEMRRNPETYQRHPIGKHVSGYKARFLTFMTLITGDKRYLEAWQKCYDTYVKKQVYQQVHWYTQNKFVQNIPYEVSHTINARWKKDHLEISPILTEVNPEIEAEISTPVGPVNVKIKKEGEKIEIKAESKNKIKIIARLKNKKRLLKYE
ncbi:MAG: hypothetical protein NC931_00150 [Candidatus Omnitrophica bacterium]|nr:hypothetical protein [Candidatus Omnitrophota bacterium]